MEPLRFKYDFRSHQKHILDRFEQERRKTPVGEPLRYHVVAPPGAGKTIVGLELAIRLGKPALVVCPNTAIQGQWVKKLEMFVRDDNPETVRALATTDASTPRWLNVLTYQILSIAEDSGESMIEIAEGIWVESMQDVQGVEEEEARARIARMKESNPPAYRKEMARFTKKLRDGKLEELVVPASSGSSSVPPQGERFLGILHPNTRLLLRRLKEAGVKTVIFDECHHLQTWWAQIMKHLLKWMDVENIIGLTATPPYDENPAVLENYIGLLGTIDFEIPTPAVVKDGMLAPYQDLLYMCRPQEAEWIFLKNCHGKFRELLVRFAKPDSDFCRFMQERILERKMADGSQRDWKKLFTTRKDFAVAGVKYLHSAGLHIPSDIAVTPAMSGHPTLDEWTLLVEDYSLNRLKLSSSKEETTLYNEIRDALYALGFILTEKGIRSYTSPLDRVLAYSRSKLTAVREILLSEMKTMGAALRAVVVTDFEFSNALSLKQLDQVLDAECGGAISVMRMMVADSELDKLNPIMVTGKSLLCDDDIAEEYQNRLSIWAQKQGYDITLQMIPSPDGTFVSIEGTGRDWNTKSAILFTTSLLEEGVTRCMIGTRGLLGEGWDSVSLNTLIDLSVATTFASVNQLRGRSIRKNEGSPRKLANNWDVVCYAPELEKGVNDALRLAKKHDKFYGICADGRISKGTAHLDARLALKDRLATEETNTLNADMLVRSGKRDPIYDLWKIGEPFQNVEQECMEFRLEQGGVRGDFGQQTAELAHLQAKTMGLTFRSGAGVLSLLAALVATGVSLPMAVIAGIASALFLYSSARGLRQTAAFGKEEVARIRPEIFARRMALAVFHALKESALLPVKVQERQVILTSGSDSSIRVFLDGTPEESALFSKSLDELLSPIADQRYAVPRYESLPPKGKGTLVFLQTVLKPGQPVLAGYHPVPEELGLNKERAVIFQKHWNRHVSRGEMVYLKSLEGQAILERFGLTDPLGVQKHVAAIWR